MLHAFLGLPARCPAHRPVRSEPDSRAGHSRHLLPQLVCESVPLYPPTEAVQRLAEDEEAEFIHDTEIPHHWQTRGVRLPLRSIALPSYYRVLYRVAQKERNT